MKSKVLAALLATVFVAIFSSSCSCNSSGDTENIYEVIRMERMVQ